MEQLISIVKIKDYNNFKSYMNFNLYNLLNIKKSVNTNNALPLTGFPI